MNNPSLASDFEAYSQWRSDLASHVYDYRQWLNDEDLNDSQRDLRLQQLLDLLAEDKLHVAFIAEFSRGKSELINAIFLSNMKQRLLPSTAGRTTMCPTELLYDPDKPPQVELLPIETRATSATVAEYRTYPEEWHRVGMDASDPESVRTAMPEVCRLKPVSVEEATRFGLYTPEAAEISAPLNKDGSVSIPAWRHAIINFPHPFLEKGLVVYDTPGLNAIGVEPELTFSLLPNAHAVLFVLAADAGVTKTDLEVWNRHLAGEDPAAPVEGSRRAQRRVARDVDIQRAALGREVNTTIADKYLSAATATPLAILTMLRKNANGHLRRIRRTSMGAYYALNSRLDDVLEHINPDPDHGIPATLSLAGQAEFILGYHHQRAADLAARARAGKQQDETPDHGEAQ